MRRLNAHESSAIPGFSCRYRCKYLVHYKKFGDVFIAISREKEIKKWSKAKKRVLVEHRNPEWVFLNKSIYRAGEDVL
jgi:putative endonuclease